MIKATHGTLHVRANVRKLAKCCSVHFDAYREFGSRGGASHHYFDGPIRHHGRVPLGKPLKALHKSFTRYRIGRNVTWELWLRFRPFNAIATAKSTAKAFAAITAK